MFIIIDIMAGKKGTSIPKRKYTRQIGPSRRNAWIAHVQAYRAQHNVPYKIALQEASKTYR